MVTARFRFEPDKLLHPDQKPFDIHLRTRTEGYIVENVNWQNLYLKGSTAGPCYIYLSGLWSSWPLRSKGRAEIYLRGTTSFQHGRILGNWYLDYLT